jgi:branched-chain amino acid transport system substrate-binding protein
MRAITTAVWMTALTVAFPIAALAQKEPVRIGVIQPLTGSVAYNGTSDINGSRLAVEERNRKGGVLGRMVELVIEDGQCKPANSVNAAEKLIQRDKVPVISGAFCSSSTMAVMPVVEKNHIPLVTGVSSMAGLTERGNRWFFRATETDALLAKSFAKILVNNLKLKTIAYIGVNDDWGRGGVDEFSKQIETLGGKTVLKEYFDHGTTDFYTLLTRLRAMQPDGIFVAAETQDGSLLVKQLKELGVQSKVFGVGSWATNDFVKLAGAAAEGIYAAVPYAATMDTPKNRGFVNAYQSKHNEFPGKYAAAGYNAINIIMDAIERAGSTDAEKIRDALANTDYEGPNGRFRFDAKGQAYGFTVVLVQLKAGMPQVVSSITVETH